MKITLSYIRSMKLVIKMRELFDLDYITVAIYEKRIVYMIVHEA